MTVNVDVMFISSSSEEESNDRCMETADGSVIATDDSLLAGLQSSFAIEKFMPHQLDAIKGTISRQDSFVILPTGAGKSLCFQLPAISEKKLTTVIRCIR